jgi:hydrogenase/urease accessory protein HupE
MLVAALRVITALAAALDLCHGCFNGTETGQTGSAAVALLGLVFALFVLIARGDAFVVQLRAAWARIAVRVAEGGIAASVVLTRGWAIHPKT